MPRRRECTVLTHPDEVLSARWESVACDPHMSPASPPPHRLPVMKVKGLPGGGRTLVLSQYLGGKVDVLVM